MGMKEAAASGADGGMTRSGPKRVAAGHRPPPLQYSQWGSGGQRSRYQQLEAISEN